MFRKNPKLYAAPAGINLPPLQSQIIDKKVVLTRKVPKLVPLDAFTLENQLRAGVPLQEVNSVVLDSSEESFNDALDRMVKAESNVEPDNNE